MPAATLYSIAKSSDPKKAILESLGDLSQAVPSLFSGRVLVAIYIAPEKTSGGIMLPHSVTKEDVWQGSVGLVVKKGNMAFKDDDTHKFHEQDVTVGDWVVFRPGDGKRIQINGVDCRIIEDSMLDMIISDPAIVTHRS